MSVAAQQLMPTLTIDGNKFRIKCSFYEKDVAKCIDGAKWNPKATSWEYPASPFTYREITESFPRIYISPEAQTAIDKMIDSDQTVNELKAEGWEKAVMLEPMPLKTKPFNHQILAFNIGIKLPNVALLMEQGCGKSLTAVAISGRRYLRGDIKQVLVAAPASVVPVWPKEYAEHGNFPTKVLALTGSTKDKVKQLSQFKAPGALAIVANNYESIWRMEKDLEKWIKQAPTMIICDESQRIKAASAEQSKALHRLAKYAMYRLILSGTPVCNSPLDIFSQYKFLDQSVFGQYQGPFKARYAVEISLENGAGRRYPKVVGYRNLEELKQKAHSIAFRCTKTECLDLPDQIDQTLYCELEPAAQATYNQMVRDSVAELENDQTLIATTILSKLLRLAQMAGGFLNVDGDVSKISDAKMKLLDETLTDLLDAGKKVVIFGRFIPEILAIRKMLEKKGIDYRYITGEVPLSERGTVVEEFQKTPTVQVFVAQIQCAGLGITLTAADTAIFYSLDFSFANYDQCRARIHRIGQKNHCTYLHLVARGTVDEKVIKALKSKRDIATNVIDSWRELLKKEEKQCQ